MYLTENQKRQVLISMIYENDDWFIGLLSKFTSKDGLRPINNSVSTPTAISFLRKSEDSRAQFFMINGSNKNWLNYMTQEELLHYLDFQNRVKANLKERYVTSSKDFFKTLTGNKVGFNEYYSTSGDCPKLTHKIQIPESEKLPKEIIKKKEIREQVLLDSIKKVYSMKTGDKTTVISPSVVSKFCLPVKAPTVTSQIVGKDREIEEEMYSDGYESRLEFIGTVYNEPIYRNIDGEYVFGDGRTIDKTTMEYIEAGELLEDGMEDD